MVQKFCAKIHILSLQKPYTTNFFYFNFYYLTICTLQIHQNLKTTKIQ